MNTKSPLVQQKPIGERQWLSNMIEGGSARKRAGVFEWWYQLTAPATPPAESSLTLRNTARRGRFVSTIMLAYIILTFPLIPTTLLSKFSLSVAIGWALVVIASIVSLVVNRRGLTIVSSVLTVILIDMAVVLPLLALKEVDLSAYDLLLVGELLAASLLPGRGVFAVALAHCAFIVVDFFFLRPHGILMQQLTVLWGSQVFLRPIALQVIVAFLTYFWVRNIGQTTTRANRAEEIAVLQHSLARQGQTTVIEKQQMEESIRQIMETHVRFANGDFAARVPLTRENVLWEVAGSLNNLLSRFQRTRQDAERFQRTQEEGMQLAQEIHAAKQRGEDIPLKNTGTVIDLIRQQVSNQRVTRQR